MKNNRETKGRQWKRLTVSGLVMAAAMLGGMGMASAQEAFNMPLSQFGLGINEMPYNMPWVSRMGGVAYTRSTNNSINPFNPASYATIEKESFVFDMGIDLQWMSQRSGQQKSNDFDGNVGYVAIGMPITGWWKVAAGMMPYSQADYESVAVQTGEGFGRVKNIYDGTGSVSQLFVGSAFNIPVGKGRSLQAGFNVDYLTGSVARGISYAFQGNDTTFYINSRRQKTTQVNNVVFDLGLQFRQSVGEKYTIGLGLTWRPYRDMTVDDEAMISTYANNGAVVDTIFPARGEEAQFESRLEQASTFGVGVSLERNRRWVVAADATFGQWNGMRYTENTAHAIMGSDAMRYGAFGRYCVGVEKLINMDAATYLGRIGWGVGVHKEQGAMRLVLAGTEHRLDEWGIGGGISLPMRKGRSMMTISAAYSSLGKSEVMRLDCFTIGIGVSSCERWFVKRKYN